MKKTQEEALKTSNRLAYLEGLMRGLAERTTTSYDDVAVDAFFNALKARKSGSSQLIPDLTDIDPKAIVTGGNDEVSGS